MILLIKNNTTLDECLELCRHLDVKISKIVFDNYFYLRDDDFCLLEDNFFRRKNECD